MVEYTATNHCAVLHTVAHAAKNLRPQDYDVDLWSCINWTGRCFTVIQEASEDEKPSRTSKINQSSCHEPNIP